MENSNILYKYKNGSYNITILKDGTKIFDGDLNYPDYPDSLDIKITDKCKNNCKFCYMNASNNGLHCNKNDLISFIKDLPKGTELAIGGGNILEYPNIQDLLLELKNLGYIPNITLHQNDIDGVKKLEDIVYGIGISLSNHKTLPINNNKNIVIHLILGISKFEDLLECYKKGYKKFLLLGYKNIGRGLNYTIDTNSVNDWKNIYIPKLFRGIEYPRDIIMSFDNMAIDQLCLKNILLKSEWDLIYNGQEFSHTMYLDAVNQKLGPSSFTKMDELTNWKDIDLLTYFRKNHVKPFNR